MGTGDGGSTLLFMDVNLRGYHLAVIMRPSRYPFSNVTAFSTNAKANALLFLTGRTLCNRVTFVGMGENRNSHTA